MPERQRLLLRSSVPNYDIGDKFIIVISSGEHKRTVFKRTQYESGDEKMLQFSLLKYHNVRFITSNGDMETFNLELTDVFTDPVRPQ